MSKNQGKNLSIWLLKNSQSARGRRNHGEKTKFIYSSYCSDFIDCSCILVGKIKANGYRTAAIGKWHLGSKDELHPNRRGFDLFYGMKAGGRDYFYDEKKSDRPGDERNLLMKWYSG